MELRRSPARRTDMDLRRYFIQVAALVLTGMVVAACGESRSSSAGSEPASPTTERQGSTRPDEEDDHVAPEGPPPVTILYSGQSATLDPWSYCYSTGCIAGDPPENPIDIGSPEEVIVRYPLEAWTFRAFFTPAGEKCGRVQPVTPEPTSDGDVLLRPTGFADTYDVTLFGRGGGDLSATFRWTTPFDGPLPEPKARIAIVSDEDADIVSYGVELSLSNLADDPHEAEAKITVTAGDGDSLSFIANRAKQPCVPVGSLYWDGPDPKGKEAARLGPSPFTYDVEVILDGERYEARARWPNDEITGNEPSVRLDFTPDLPALSDS